MSKALSRGYRISTHITKKASHTKTTVYTGAITLTQGFGSTLNLNVHKDEYDPMHQKTGELRIRLSLML
jgi:hypothetical protein